jgi:predicted TIM-barrel fold metal-dependent hydrolase
MRNGLRVYDADTHVNPAAEILERYVDPSFRPRLLELAPYRVPTGTTTAPLKHRPSDYLINERFFCSIERHEGEDMFNFVTQFLGDDVLMYASDYPHAECQFPNSVDNVLRWSSLKPDTTRKPLWDNAI